MIHIFSHICGQNDHIVALMRKKGEKRIDVMGCDVTRLGCDMEMTSYFDGKGMMQRLT